MKDNNNAKHKKYLVLTAYKCWQYLRQLYTRTDSSATAELAVTLTEYYKQIDLIRSHMKCGTCMCLIGLKPPPPPEEDLCARSSALNFSEIPMIFYRRIPWVVPECSAKFQPNYSRFCEMAAILNKKNNFFCNFLKIYFWLFQRNLAGTLLGVRGTLSVNLTLNDLDPGK